MSQIVKKSILDTASGQIMELADNLIEQVIEDINNDEKAEDQLRTITLKLSFKPSNERTEIDFKVDGSVSLAKKKPVRTRFQNVTEVYEPTGEKINVLKEITSAIPGQISLGGGIVHQEVVIIGKAADYLIQRQNEFVIDVKDTSESY